MRVCDILYIVISLNWSLPCTIKIWSFSIYNGLCFTSLMSDRQPPFRMSYLMLRFSLWWSAVYVTIWTTEALTMHSKPSKWPQAEVRYQAVATLVTARALCWVFCPIGLVLLWLCCTGLQPLWSTITLTMQSWSYRVRSDPLLHYIAFFYIRFFHW